MVSGRVCGFLYVPQHTKSMFVCVHLCLFACLYVSMCVCVCVCVRVSLSFNPYEVTSHRSQIYSLSISAAVHSGTTVDHYTSTPPAGRAGNGVGEGVG